MAGDGGTERSIEAVKQRTPNGENFRIIDIQEQFMSGSLYTVAFEIVTSDSGAVATLNNRVYLRKSDTKVFANDELLIASIGSENKRDWAPIISRAAIVPGVIAIILTITICYLAVNQNTAKVPDILANALSVILGYCFARATDK